jgi:methylenetetrahydrofolate dehydrogenase (NADP+)/methenyltetrahydrofolate cyclohydrolase
MAKNLADYIKERQAHQVRGLRQANNVVPALAIIVTTENPIIDLYVNLKKQYGTDIDIDVFVYRVRMGEIEDLIEQLNNDQKIHGIIVQLPLEDTSRTEEIVNLISPEKDVDGLNEKTVFQSATPMAILWLLSGYNIDLRGKKILLVGRGRLVGAPLEKELLSQGMDVSVAVRDTRNLKDMALQSDVIISAAGSPAILFSDMIKENAVVVDAGVASEDGKTIGDVAPEVYERDDLTITPVKGGVGPLTVTALFDNVIRAARASVK